MSLDLSDRVPLLVWKILICSESISLSPLLLRFGLSHKKRGHFLVFQFTVFLVLTTRTAVFSSTYSTTIPPPPIQVRIALFSFSFFLEESQLRHICAIHEANRFPTKGEILQNFARAGIFRCRGISNVLMPEAQDLGAFFHPKD